MTKFIKRIVNKFAEFRKDRSAAAGIVLAVSLVPLAGLTGLAVDYSNVKGAQTRLDSAADAAALYSVTEGVLKPDATIEQQLANAKAAAKKDFEAQLAGLALDRVTASGTYTTSDKGGAVVSKVCYSAVQKTMLMGVIGISEMQITGCAEAVSATMAAGGYVSVYVLVDASGSMGIGASNSDRALMNNRLGCVFACHSITENTDWDCGRNWLSQTTDCAHAIGATLRFDVVKQAIKTMADRAQALAKTPNQFRIAITKFSNYPTNVLGLNGSMTQVKNAVDAMQQDVEGGGTNIGYIMPQFVSSIPTSGDGTTPDKPKVFVMIITDGMQIGLWETSTCVAQRRGNCINKGHIGDTKDDPNWSHHGSATFQSSYCDNIKKKGATVVTLEVEYADGYGIDASRRPVAQSELKKCATSSDLAFSADQGVDILKAVNSMFKKVAQGAVRLAR